MKNPLNKNKIRIVPVVIGKSGLLLDIAHFSKRIFTKWFKKNQSSWKQTNGNQILKVIDF